MCSDTKDESCRVCVADPGAGRKQIGLGNCQSQNRFWGAVGNGPHEKAHHGRFGPTKMSYYLETRHSSLKRLSTDINIQVQDSSSDEIFTPLLL